LGGRSWGSYTQLAVRGGTYGAYIDLTAGGAGSGNKIAEYKIQAVDLGGHVIGFTTPIQIHFEGSNPGGNKGQIASISTPTEYLLLPTYPNPFNPTTTVEFSVPEYVHVTVRIYNAMGQELAGLVDEDKEIGTYQFTFDGSKLSSGIYFCDIVAGKFHQVQKMILQM